MKKLLLIFVSLSMMVFLSSCKKDDGGWKFDYPQEVLCGGTWTSTAFYSSEQGKWVDMTSSYMKSLRFSIKFNTDFTYYASGALGTGGGTYTAEGNTITTYAEGEKNLTCVVRKMESNVAEVNIMDNTGASQLFRLEK